MISDGVPRIVDGGEEEQQRREGDGEEGFPLVWSHKESRSRKNSVGEEWNDGVEDPVLGFRTICGLSLGRTWQRTRLM